MRLRVCLIVVGQMLTGTAVADPYPFSGFYALETPGQGTAACGFDILHQSQNGEFSGYILDRRHWDAHKQARFLRYKNGKCTYDSRTALDNCVTHENHINDVVDAKPDRAKITIIDDDAVAMLTLGEGDDAEQLGDFPPFVFRRCPFDDDTIRPLLSDGVAGYSRADLQEMARSRDGGLMSQVLNSITKAGRTE